MSSLFAELRRRKVIRVAAAYAVMGWVIIQVVSDMFPALNLPDWTVTLVAALLLIGFPVALLLAWAFEMTPDGVRAEPEADEPGFKPDAAIRPPIIDFVLLVLLVVVLAVSGYYLARQGPREDESAFETTDGVISEATGLQSIAVLPFLDLSSEGDQQYFADGIAEEILNALAGTKGLKVAARTSSFQFRGEARDVSEIGQVLGVQTLLEGSIRKAGNRVRITVQLINVADGFHIWSHTFDRELTDIFAIQDEIAHNIVGALLGELDVGEDDPAAPIAGTTNLEAFSLYLEGSFHRHKRTLEDVTRSIELFERAKELDPEYADAYAGLARSYFVMNNFENVDAVESPYWSDAREMLGRALSLNPKNPQALLFYAAMRHRMWRFESAEKNFIRGLEANPNDWEGHFWYAQLLLTQARLDEAIRELNLAKDINPLNPFYCVRIFALVLAGRDDEVEREIAALGEERSNRQCVKSFELFRALGEGREADARALMEDVKGFGGIALRAERALGEHVLLDEALAELAAGQGPLAGRPMGEAWLYAFAGEWDLARERAAEGVRNRNYAALNYTGYYLGGAVESRYYIDVDVDYSRLLRGHSDLEEAYAKVGIDLSPDLMPNRR